MTGIGRIEIARRFSREIRSRLGDRVEDVILYGSVARGDDGEESDIDILVVSRSDEKDLQFIASDIAYDIAYDEGEMISVHVYPREHLVKFGDISFFKTVVKEGHVLG
jgi:uncharacterized protein